MEAGAVEEASENVGHLFLHDTGAVVFDRDDELVLVHFRDFDE
jgi:hypothetical protein